MARDDGSIRSDGGELKTRAERGDEVGFSAPAREAEVVCKTLIPRALVRELGDFQRLR